MSGVRIVCLAVRIVCSTWNILCDFDLTDVTLRSIKENLVPVSRAQIYGELVLSSVSGRGA